MPHTNEEMREEFIKGYLDKVIPYDEKNQLQAMILNKFMKARLESHADFWLNKISDLKKSIREEIAKIESDKMAKKQRGIDGEKLDEQYVYGFYKGIEKAKDEILSLKSLEWYGRIKKLT